MPLLMTSALSYGQTPSPAAMADLPPSVDVLPAADAGASATPHGLDLQLWLQRFEDRMRRGDEAGGATSDMARAIVDFRHEWRWTPALRIGLSNRYDAARVLDRDAAAPDHSMHLNSLREAWLSCSVGSTTDPQFVDGGRINWRIGVASGYNPTDFLKAGAVRSASSADPGALRFERLGTVMLRAQRLSDAGALSLAIAPRLSSRESIDDRTFSLALDRTNRQASALLVWAPRLSETLSMDLLAFAREGERTQSGANLTYALGDAWVGYAEWAGGDRETPGAPHQPLSKSWRNRMAVGAVWTTPVGVELTIEHQYAGDALSREHWDAWRRAPAGADQRALGDLATRRAGLQEPLVRAGWFARVAWRDLFSRQGLQLSGFIQANSYDGSRAWQMKLSWPLTDHWSLVTQAGGYDGAPDTEFGSVGLHRSAAVYVSRVL